MLHPAYLLRADAAGKLAVLRIAATFIRPAIIVPRSICVFESLPCRGLAWHEQPGFARTQARRLTPFEDYGFNACVRGRRLHLWFWDHAEVRAAMASLPVQAASTRMWAEPLLLPAPKGTGNATQECDGGAESRTLVDGAIVESRWQARASTALPAYRRLPWAWELAGQRLAPRADAPQALSLARAGRATAYVALVGAAAWAAHWEARRQASLGVLVQAEASLQDASQKMGDSAALRAQATELGAWLDAFARQARNLDWPGLIESLRPVLRRYGVVVKEIEVRGEEVRLSVASAGSDIDLPELLRALSATEGLTDVQLSTGLNLTQATFSMRARGFVGAAIP